MKKIVVLITSILIFFPIGILFYKSSVLNLSLVPQMVDDVWNFHLTVKPKGEVYSFSFPIPKSSAAQRVSDEKIRSKDFEVFIDSSSDSNLATWSSRNPIQNSVSYSARIDLNPILLKKIPKDYTEKYPKGLKQYLKVPELLQEDIDAITTLENAILEGSEDKTSLIRKIYYYVEEEIHRNTAVKTIHETLKTGKGSPLIKAKLFNIMARRHGVPSRIVVMVRMPELKQVQETKLRFTFANEVFLANKWIPIDTNRGYFGERPDTFLVIHRNYQEVERLISKQKVAYSIQAERAKLNRYNKAEFKKEVIKSDSIFSKLSLYRLPLPIQTMFTTILLIPIGTLVLALARNIIGIPTFGIFTPILLTLFFKETSFGFGMLFFGVVVGMGILEKYILDRFYLLAVPRLSIILTLIIMLMLGYSFFSIDMTSTISQKHLSFFPIVIVTLIIERLSIMITEEGMLNTFKTLLGTLIIVILVYSLYFIDALEMFMFTNPELLFTIIGLLILVGKYKGYRLSEFIRFKDLVKQKKRMESMPNDLP